MTQTSTTTQEISEVIEIERYGGDVYTWKGDNIEALDANGNATDLQNSAVTFEIVDTAQPWQLEIISRSAGIVETEDITRTIEVEATVTTLSVFSQ